MVVFRDADNNVHHIRHATTAFSTAVEFLVDLGRDDQLQWIGSQQVQNDVLDECVQLHGGYGFMNEYRVARAWRDARVTSIWAGSNEIMKEIIGRSLGL